MKIGITGTRQGIQECQKIPLMKLLFNLPIVEFRHGGCVGVDEWCHDYVVRFCLSIFKIIVHPPIIDTFRMSWDKLKKEADVLNEPQEYLERNHRIVDCSDLLIAIPTTANEELRSGTWATVRYAKKIKKPIVLILPDR